MPASSLLAAKATKPNRSSGAVPGKAAGYDGGPVFSRDGKKLVWRANHPKTPQDMERYKSLLADNLTAPMKMELLVADADGSHLNQITNFGCASFAPTFTPDGKKILFFPEFAPDGKSIVYASDKDAKTPYEFNIFTAAWNAKR